MKILDILMEGEYHKTDSGKTYWGKTGAGAIFFCTATGRFLFGLRSSKVEEPHTWGGFGGAVDPKDSSPLQAAKREAGEETKFDVDKMESHKLVYTYKDDDFKYYNYVFFVDKEFVPELNAENDDAKWFALDIFPAPLHFGLKTLVKSGALTKIKMKQQK